MSLRAVLMCAALALTCLVASCMDFRLPTTEEVEQIFVAAEPEEADQDRVPEHVPILNATELGGWRQLCDQCHIGPAYSSHTNLVWGHRESCIADTSCLNCHGQDLHRMDVRGNKQVCYSCHLARDLPVSCITCHTAEHVAEYRPHQAGFLGEHGSYTLREGFACYHCHGSERWCLDCHGLPMPHPADIIDTHPALVQGQPETCANCHGSRSCIRCHLALGVQIGQ